jgi:hypothetical protein
MNQGTQGYSLTKKTEGRKSRDTVSLNSASFDTHKSHIMKKNFCPLTVYVVIDPEKDDLPSKGHLTNKLFLLF